MKKKFLIAGVPLAWKSTLAVHVSSTYCINHIPLDSIVTAFDDIFPAIWIRDDFWLTLSWYQDLCELFTPFIQSMVEELDEQHIYWWYILEWCHRDIKKLALYKHSHTVLILGYPSVSLEEKFHLVRQTDKTNRTNKRDDETLKQIINFRITVSKRHLTLAKDLWIPYIDTNKHYESLFSY